MASDSVTPHLRRFALLVEYDGTAYCGSQFQENGPTIQSAVETAIAKLTGSTTRVGFAGRTDAGVHAVGQVASFEVQSRLGTAELRSGLNHFLPEDIAVREVVEVDARFDPRRDAVARLYRYEIENSETRSPLSRNRRWWIDRPLDVPAMRRTARRIEGQHDFAAFAGAYEGSTRRTMRRCELVPARHRLRLVMEAPSFLPHQVRRTAGALVEVGLGRMSESTIDVMLDDPVSAPPAPAAPPHGLYLVAVRYDSPLFAAEQDGCVR